MIGERLAPRRTVEQANKRSLFGLLAVWGVLGLFDAGLGTGVTGAILALSLAGRERLK